MYYNYNHWTFQQLSYIWVFRW